MKMCISIHYLSKLYNWSISGGDALNIIGSLCKEEINLSISPSASKFGIIRRIYINSPFLMKKDIAYILNLNHQQMKLL